jgi:hypothetical protein
MSRYDALTKKEQMMIHHALRVLLTHPRRMLEEDEQLATKLADEIWDEHANEVAKTHSLGSA